MINESKVTKRLFIYFVAVLFLAIFSFGIYSLVTGLISFGKDDGWDGTVIATEFKQGNGTLENPYMIYSPEEFMYFKQVLEGENYKSYQDKYYVLGDTIDFNGKSITPIGASKEEEERYFAGHFNGNGYALTNFKIEQPSIVDKVEYYSLFTKTVNATFTSLGITNYRIEVKENDTVKVVAPLVGECIGKEADTEEPLASYSNLYLKDFYVDVSNVSDDSKVNALIGNVTGKFLIRNIFIKGEVNANSSLLPIHFVTSGSENRGNIYNVIQNVKVLNSEGKTLSYDGMDNVYEYRNQSFYFRDELVSAVTVLAFLNDDIGSDCYWAMENDGLVIYPYEKEVIDIPETSKGFSFSIRPVGAITAHDSGQDGNTFYINDLTADYNYLKGLNYTDVRSTSLPTGNTSYYDSQYLVKVQIIYDGADINNSSLVGALSPVATENGINKFVYYKYYPLERATNGTLLTNSSGNHYIRIELIDNPFSKRPYVSNKEYGFNGWACNQNVDSTDHLCENSTIYFSKNNYTRYMEIAVDGGSEIVVHLNASWVEADVRTSYNDIGNFQFMNMQPMGTISHYTTETTNGNAYWKQNYTTMVYVDTYDYYDGYMPRYSWYKENQTGTTYTYITSSRTRCRNGRTCYVYTANTSGIVGGTQYTGGSYSFVPNFTNYGNNTEITVNNYNRTYMDFEADPNGMFTDTIQMPHYTTTMVAGDSTIAFFYEVNNPTTAMINTKEYYQSNGSLCTSTTSCPKAYKLVQYGDSVLNRKGHSISEIEVENGEVVDADKYYYLVTRDTNIFRYTSTTHLVMDNLEVNRPFTVTGTTVNGTTTSGILEYPSSGWFTITYSDFQAENDIVIENIKIDGPDTAGTNNTNLGGNSKTSQVIYANSHNLKIGRNVTSSDDSNYLVAQAVFGGTNSSVDGTFKIIIESGNYYAYHSGPMSGSTNTTLNETTIIGSDYDRIKNVHNKLRFNIGIDGYAGGHNTAGSDSLFASYNIVKSGTLGYNSDGTPSTDNTSGMYIGGRASTCVESLTGAKIEGGNINTVVGGYGYNGSTTTNSTFIGMSGGTVRGIYGGAGHSTTKGNRIINVTGGTVKYSVLGGSDSYSSSDTDDGVVQGSTLVYVGGNATIGDGSTDELNGVESGSVFGAGGGRDPGNNSTTTKGTVYNSHVIINGATIAKSVYGGGNFGSTGTQSNSSASTVIDIISGTMGSVYGGSKAAGFSKSDYLTQSSIDINVTGGTIGTIYGGSDDKGEIYGVVNIDVKDGTITGNVYGGGRGANTFVDSSVNVTIGGTINNKPTIAGNVYGGSAYGTVNAATVGGTVHGTTTVKVNNGVVTGSVFGGAEGSSSATPYVYGNITVEVNNGSIGKVFGGFDAVGEPGAGDVVYLKGGTVGNAFGGGNNTGQSTTDIRLQGSTITGNLYGGSNLLGVVSSTNVSVTSGSVTDIYGGNNLGGTSAVTHVSVTGGTINGDTYGGGNEAASTTSYVTVSGATVHDVYGGGKQAGLTTSNVQLQNATAGKVFGGSNVSGNVTTSNVNVLSSQATSAYGGNNQGGVTTTTNVDITSSSLTNVFGGGDNATSGVSNVTIHSGTISNVYGGGNEAGLTTSNVKILDGTITNAFGGSNSSGNVATSNVTVGDVLENISMDIQYTKRAPGYWPQSNKPTYAQVSVTLTNNTNEDIQDWAVELTVPNSEIFANDSQSNITISGNTFSVNSTNRYYGTNALTANGGTYTFQFDILSDTPLADFDITGRVLNQYYITPTGSNNIQITNLYGGNNLGGVTNDANITAVTGTMGTIYGGGKNAAVGTTNVVLSNITATNVYGGGDAAGVTGNTYLDIDDSTVTNNIYGGGNEGIVQGNTEVFVTDSHIQGNAFAGGNGSTAVVHRDSTITIDGNSEIGTSSSVAPNDGCVFGSGNAASTGLESTNNSHATVNFVGGRVHGNVYGGPKMAVVYGVTNTNIGMAAVNNNSLLEDDIVIDGTVFGGGESNASGSTTYDWTFISVTRGITVNINGTDYLTNNHAFAIHGSIFGSGNASSSSGTSEIYVKNLGTLSAPNKSISIQRTNYLEIDASAIELEGTTDRTNEYNDILYSLNIIDKMVIKNDTSLLLHHNANLLKELYSGVDGNNGLEPAVVEIDDENETLNMNVNNRIYMLPGQNLNVTINQAATAYGKVTGMTFFGMFLAHEGGGYRYGLYDPNITYGMSGNAGLEIVGGSYVLGLHNVNHDITKDGFYSNYVDTTHNKILTAYIDPTEIGSTGYRWSIGFEAINYEFTLTASKYSSLGTYELQIADFGQGNVTFNVLGFDSSGLNTYISLVDPANVPRIGRTEAQANSILGLAMKAETQEWTAYGTTKLLSTNGGTATGTEMYRTDSRQIPPSMMFYLYHAKNISSQENMGKVVVTLEAAVPKNAIESDIHYITVTINLISKQYEDADSYDASITYDKRYEMPSTTLVNITNTSQFSTYYSLIAWSDTFAGIYGNQNTNFHTLVTDHPLPVNTMITMLDYGANANRPEYYYFRVTQAVYNDSLEQLRLYSEISYPLRNFIKMDSTSSNNTYNDQAANLLYYDSEIGLVDEEFMFIFDFKECTQVTGEHLNNTMLFELRNSEDRTVFNVLGIRESVMVYNTYDSSNVVLQQTITEADDYLYYNIPDEMTYTTNIRYDETENRQSVIDTNYESSSMGLNIMFLDTDGEPVSSSLLLGTNFIIDNHQYFADADGVFRIKLAGKVSNLIREAQLTINKDLPAGPYTMRYTLFASDDGLHNSNTENSVTWTHPVTVVNANSSIKVTCDDTTKLVDGEAAVNMANSIVNNYVVQYQAVLVDPNLRVEVYKRDVSNINSNTYISIPFSQLFDSNFNSAGGNEVYLPMNGQTQKTFSFGLQRTLTSGTYRIVFKLYDNNQLIDDDVQYVIVHKKTE